MRLWSPALVAAVLCTSTPFVSAQDVLPIAVTPVATVLSDASAEVTEATTTTAQEPLTMASRGAMPSVRSLFTELRHDVRNAATTSDTVIMLTAGASAALIHPYDYRITDDFSSSPSLVAFLGPGKIMGGTAVQFGGAAAAYGIGRIIRHERTAIVGADLVRAQLVNTVFTQGLKLTVNRTRPDGDSWSFPSGHSSGTFANATVLQRHFGWKAGAPAYAFATYVAASRLSARRHFASDVIFGAAIGIVSGRAVTVGRGNNRFAVAPMSVPGGAGITFTRLAP
jgi:membrane-associated phospholipid phosphatase